MKTRGRHSGGFTLVELLVVLGIIALMAAVAIPGLASIGAFSRDHLNNSSRELYSMLKASRMYAATYNVDAGVVYNLDNYVDILDDGANTPRTLPDPVHDSVTDENVRVIENYAMVYALPPDITNRLGREELYIQVENENGEFHSFPGDMALLLQNPFSNAPYYYSERPRFDAAAEQDGGTQQIHQLGMRTIPLLIGAMDGGEFVGVRQYIDFLAAGNYAHPITVEFPAHIFQPNGRMDVGGGRERFTIYVAPPPDELPQLRLIDPEDPTSERIHVPIELYRSTGRVRIAS